MRETLAFLFAYRYYVAMTLSEYLKQSGRGALQRLSKTINAHAPDVSRWSTGLRPIPFHHAAAIEKATGGLVTRQDMFPDTWAVLWPELAAKSRKRKAQTESA